MTAYQDFEEKSVEKAVETACSQLGINCEKLKYDIISHGSSGIFGLVGAKKAVIRVALPESRRRVPSEPVEPEPQEPENKEEQGTVAALVDEAFGPVPETTDTTTEPPSTVQPVHAEKVDAPAVADWIRGFLDQVIALISPDSQLHVQTGSDPLRFEIRGGDSARLIGKRGQTLDAIHYLVEKGAYKQFGASLSIEIDVEGYLEKRRSELTALAARLAQKAQETGKPMVINRISSQDRRVVHLSLRENREVRTQSVGNGEMRKLLIMPKKKGQSKRSQPRTE